MLPFDSLSRHFFRLGLRNRDPRGPQNAIPNAITRLQDLYAGWAIDTVGMGMQQRLVDMRVERIARLAEGLQTVFGGDALDLLGNRLEATVELFMLTSRAHVVQDRS